MEGARDPQLEVSFFSTSPEQTQGVGAALGALVRPGDVILLTGDLGAGKTQFTKGVARALGVSQAVTSPTFNLMHEYTGVEGMTLRHFDLYRLEDAEELDDIDYFGLLEEDAVSVVEWGDRFPSALPLDYLLVAIELHDEQARTLHLGATGAHATRLLAEAREALHAS
jgi:tRNA threonylcarbamoyladenosine biosynthesis protein TsaE